MLSVTKRPVFNLSLISSGMLLYFVTYHEKWLSTWWLGFGLLEVMVIAFFIGTLIYSLAFWLKKHVYRIAYVPFAINLITVAVIFALPLNNLRNRAEFKLFHNRFEVAAHLAASDSLVSKATKYQLKGKFYNLSAGGGEADVIRNNDSMAVFFYTYKGRNGDKKGFIKLLGKKPVDAYYPYLCSNIETVKPMGNNWYYIAGE